MQFGICRKGFEQVAKVLHHASRGRAIEDVGVVFKLTLQTVLRLPDDEREVEFRRAHARA